MEERDFYVILQSDSCPNYFVNTITDFRNIFSPPIKLEGRFEVALVECSYVHSNVIIERGERICTYNGELITANKNYTELTELIEDLKIDGMKIENGLIKFNSSEKETNKKKSTQTNSIIIYPFTPSYDIFFNKGTCSPPTL